VQVRTEALAAVNAIAAVASRSLDVNAMLTDVLDKTLEVMGIEGGGVYLLDEPTGVLTLTAQQGFGPELAAEIDGLRVGEGFSGRVAQSGLPLVVQNAYQDPRLTRSAVQAQQPRSLAVVPLVAKDRILGSLFAVTQRDYEFADREVQLLTSIGQQIGVAVENASLYEAEQRRAEQFRVVSEVGRHITSILPVDELLDEIVRLIKESFGYYLVTVGLIEEDQVVFRAGAKTDWPEPQFLPPSLPVGSSGITAWVAATGKPLLAPDVSQEPRYLFWPDSSETRSELAVPLLTKTGVIGVLNVESDRLNAFDLTDVQMLQSLANQAAIAIENARLYEQAQRRMRELEALYRADSELYRHLDLDEVLQALVDMTVDILQADKSALLVWDPGRARWVARVARGFAPETIALLSFARAEGSVGQAATTHEPVVVQNALADLRRQDERPEIAEALLVSEGIRSFMHLPIQHENEVLGILNVGFTAERAFGQHRVRLFTAVAVRAALAIESARLQEQTREIAIVQERSRLARELHDAVTQTLFSGSLISEALPAVWESDQEEGQQLLQ
jgi:GAF domain-containing protein